LNVLLDFPCRLHACSVEHTEGEEVEHVNCVPWARQGAWQLAHCCQSHGWQGENSLTQT
jgi:hypothetical protein